MLSGYRFPAVSVTNMPNSLTDISCPSSPRAVQELMDMTASCSGLSLGPEQPLRAATGITNVRQIMR